MSITGLDLRKRARRRLVRLLDTVIATLDPQATSAQPAPAPAAPPPAGPAPQPAAAPPRDAKPTPAPAPSAPPAAAPAPAPLPPLPGIPAARARPPLDAAAPRTAEPAPAPKAPSAPPSPASDERPRQSPEERQQKHWSRTRAGVLRFVHDKGGAATLREMHDYSESTFFVAHVGFSRLMEELTDEGLLDYDHDSATASLTDAGRAELA